MATTDESKSYKIARDLAYEKRELYSVDGRTLNLTKIREIYSSEGINLIYKEDLKNLKAFYMADEDGTDVLCNKGLPKEPKLFALIHELKHHYLDRHLLCAPCCMNYGEEPEIEIAAEVFAAEFIWPFPLFKKDIQRAALSIPNITPSDLVIFKRNTGYPVSYKFIKKRFEQCGLIAKGSFDKENFKKLEYTIYGVPFYLRNRSTRSSSFS